MPTAMNTHPWNRFARMAVAALMLATAVAFGAAAPANAATTTETVNGITYTADDTTMTATITDYDAAAGRDVAIPSAVTLSDTNSYVVTAIGDNAFMMKGVTSVTIPDSVTTIGAMAFFLNELTSVTIPDSVTRLGFYAFNLNRLTSITLPDAITALEDGVFGSNRLTSVTIPGSVTRIDSLAFFDNALTSVTIPASVTSIGVGAFGTNPGLVSAAFEGAAPVSFFAGISGNAAHGSFGDPDTGVVVTYLDRFEPSGFTNPTWQGYQSRALVVVTFEPNGASPIDPLTVVKGEAVAAPAAPTRAGYSFTGWFADAGATVPHDFSAPVQRDATLFAGWDRITHTVTFASAGGSVVDAATVAHGESVVAPAAPTRAGYSFTGWFADAAATVPYDFSAPVQGDQTLHAGWVAEPTVTPAPSVPPTPGPGVPTPDAPGPDSPAPDAPTSPGASTLPVTGGVSASWLAIIAGVLLAAGLLFARTGSRARE